MRIIISMKRLANVGFLVLLSLGLASRAAFGLAMIMLDDGVGNTVTITDQTGACVGTGCAGFAFSGAGNFDLAPAVAGQLTVSGQLGIWQVNVSTGLTKPQSGSATNPHLDLSSVNQSVGAGTMTIKFTDTGFGPLPPGQNAFFDAIGGTTLGRVSIRELYDPEDGAFTGTEIARIDNLTGNPFMGSATSSEVAGLAPFSLTQIVVITHAGTGQQTTSFNYAKDVVPEPSALLLLGSGLLGFGYLRRRVLRRS